MKKQFDGISKRARLLLSSGEGKGVEYKESLKGLGAEDLVAFANSKCGGAILIGVREVHDGSKPQSGEAIGHPVDDDSRLQIISKALSCAPPVKIEIYIENLKHLPFFRVEIPSGHQKPYSTSSGTYKIREDARNTALLPGALLELFMEREASQFRSRFSDATLTLVERMSDTVKKLGNLEDIVSDKIEAMGTSLGWAEHKAGESLDTIEAVSSLVQHVIGNQTTVERRIKAIAEKVGASDPIKCEIEKAVLDEMVARFSRDKDLRNAIQKKEPLSVSVSGRWATELTKGDLSRIVNEAAQKASLQE